MENGTAASLQVVQKLALLLVCICFVSSVAVAGGDSGYAPPPSHYYCMATPTAKTSYISGLFLVPASTPYNAISSAFTQFIAGKYGKTGNVACFGDPDEAKARKQMQQMSVQTSGHSVVETGWVYKAATPSTDPNYNPHGASAQLPSYNSHGSSPPPAAHSQNEETPASQPPATPKPGPASVVDGVYTGTYTCAKGPAGLKLTLKAPEYGLLTGTFTFYLPPGSHTKAYTFSLNGHFDPTSGNFKLNPLKWEGPEPPNYMMVGLKGAVDTQTGKVSGVIDYSGCGRFEAMKGRED